MSNGGDWDIETLRQEWESDEHWEIRRSFMVTYKDKFPEDKVVCLAQVYANVELLGCRYPDAVMARINELAKGLDTHRPAKEADSIKFVKSSEERSSGGYTGSQPPSKKLKLSNAEQVTNFSKGGFLHSSSLSASSLPANNNSRTDASSFSSDVRGAEHANESTAHPKQSNQQVLLSSREKCPEQESVISKLRAAIEKLGPKSLGGCHLMSIAASSCGVKIDWIYNSPPVPKKQNPVFVCELLAESILLGVGTDRNKKSARNTACDSALTLLKFPRTELTVISTGPESYQLISCPEPVVDKPRNNERTGSYQCETSTKKVAIPGNKSFDVPSSLIVVIETFDMVNEIETLTRTAAFNKIPLDFDYQEELNGSYRCDIWMNGKIIASATNYAKQLVKQEAAAAALKYLKTLAYIVKIKSRFIAEGSISRESVSTELKEDESISEDNIGNKLLRMMGWSGGGLGKDGEGIAEPVKASTVFGREGLGLSSQQGVTKKFIQQVTTVIREYAQSTSNTDLAFSADFTSDERKEMHMIAKRFNLKSVSRGKGENRFLVLSRKFGPQQLVQHILERGGSTDKYELIPPPYAQ